MIKKMFLLVFSVLIPLAVGLCAAMLTGNAMSDFANFIKPPLAPPASAFPIAWTILYIMMGVASFLVIVRHTTANVQIPLIVYSLQLAVNFSWSIVFFLLGMRWTALGILVVLWLLVYTTMVLFRSVSKLASWMMVPYLIWLTYAAYLNIGVAILN